MKAAGTALLKSGLAAVRNETLKLVDLGDPVQTKNPTTLEYETTYPNRATAWTGLGTLQPDLRRAPVSIPDGAGGVREVAVSFTVGLPANAPVTPGVHVEDSIGRLYPQVTEPVLPGGMVAEWLLRLGPSI